VKYHSKVDFDFLVSTLSTLYQVKSHPIASKFLGLFLYDNTVVARSIAVFYPGYVDGILQRLRPLGVEPALTPTVYIPPSYGSLASVFHPRHLTIGYSCSASRLASRNRINSLLWALRGRPDAPRYLFPG
jgi:hypothetical protein